MSEEEVNGFRNDGSFLEQFKKMQGDKKQKEEGKGERSQPTSSLALKGLKTGPISIKIGRGRRTFAVGKLKKPTLATDKAFGLGNSESEDAMIKDEDEPAPVCGIPLATPCTPHSITTLTPPSSSAHNITGHSSTTVKKEATAGSSQDVSSGAAGRKRKRKSRWGETPSTTTTTEEDSQIATAMASFSPSPSPSSSQLPQQQLTVDQQHQLQEQIEMNKMVAEVQAATQLLSKEKKNKKKKSAGAPNQYEYDSDEETEDGTWEHKARVSEMQKTKTKAVELTELGKGKHHIGDFLPPEELDKFIERVTAIKEGRTPDLTDYKEHKLTEENVGFKLLQKAGWSDGSGLGSKEDGIQAPINKGKTSFDQAGLGVEAPGDVAKEDSAFETYRKRMMLAYRFRPNPLNNPRRPYY